MKQFSKLVANALRSSKPSGKHARGIKEQREFLSRLSQWSQDVACIAVELGNDKSFDYVSWFKYVNE